METENKTNIVPTEVENPTENVVELTDELAENHESAEESVEDTENETENEEKKEETPKVEPLEEQKPFIYSPYERAILEEMERRAKDNAELAKGLKDKDKSIKECFAFVTHRAKKLATDTCAMIEDSVVYAWAQFYYTQRREIIDLEYKATKPTYTPPTPKTKADTKASNKVKNETKKTDTKKTDAGKKEDKANPNVEEVTGGDGKVYKIESLSLF